MSTSERFFSVRQCPTHINQNIPFIVSRQTHTVQFRSKATTLTARHHCPKTNLSTHRITYLDTYPTTLPYPLTMKLSIIPCLALFGAALAAPAVRPASPLHHCCPQPELTRLQDSPHGRRTSTSTQWCRHRRFDPTSARFIRLRWWWPFWSQRRMKSPSQARLWWCGRYICGGWLAYRRGEEVASGQWVCILTGVAVDWRWERTQRLAMVVCSWWGGWGDGLRVFCWINLNEAVSFQTRIGWRVFLQIRSTARRIHPCPFLTLVGISENIAPEWGWHWRMGNGPKSGSLFSPHPGLQAFKSRQAPNSIRASQHLFPDLELQHAVTPDALPRRLRKTRATQRSFAKKSAQGLFQVREQQLRRPPTSLPRALLLHIRRPIPANKPHPQSHDRLCWLWRGRNRPRGAVRICIPPGTELPHPHRTPALRHPINTSAMANRLQNRLLGCPLHLSRLLRPPPNRPNPKHHHHPLLQQRHPLLHLERSPLRPRHRRLHLRAHHPPLLHGSHRLHPQPHHLPPLTLPHRPLHPRRPLVSHLSQHPTHVPGLPRNLQHNRHRASPHPGILLPRHHQRPLRAVQALLAPLPAAHRCREDGELPGVHAGGIALCGGEYLCLQGGVGGWGETTGAKLDGAVAICAWEFLGAGCVHDLGAGGVCANVSD